MEKTNKILLGSALLAVMHFAHAQTAADALGSSPSQEYEIEEYGVEVTPYTTEGATSGSGSVSGSSESALTPQTVTVISAPFTVGSTDPFVQRREARAQAREEYEASKRAARREYKEEKREADAEFRQSVQ